MQMEVVSPQEFSCLAMVFPHFKGMPGKKREYWRPHPLATILLANTTDFFHSHRRLNNEALVPVNLGDSATTCGMNNPICFKLLTKS